MPSLLSTDAAAGVCRSPASPVSQPPTAPPPPRFWACSVRVDARLQYRAASSRYRGDRCGWMLFEPRCPHGGGSPGPVSPAAWIGQRDSVYWMTWRQRDLDSGCARRSCESRRLPDPGPDHRVSLLRAATGAGWSGRRGGSVCDVGGAWLLGWRGRWMVAVDRHHCAGGVGGVAGLIITPGQATDPGGHKTATAHLARVPRVPRSRCCCSWCLRRRPAGAREVWPGRRRWRIGVCRPAARGRGCSGPIQPRGYGPHFGPAGPVLLLTRLPAAALPGAPARADAEGPGWWRPTTGCSGATGVPYHPSCVDALPRLRASYLVINVFFNASVVPSYAPAGRDGDLLHGLTSRCG